MYNNIARIFLLVLVMQVIACSSQQTKDRPLADNSSAEQQIGLNPDDPWEGFNRSIFSFNKVLDDYFLRPIAVGYDAITPDFVQSGISNFISNLEEVYNIANNLLQGDGEGVGTSFMRLTVNTTFGLLGLLDVASEVGMTKDEEDFGQTLAVWGVPQGNYLVLPIFGPSTTRDIFKFTDNVYYNSYSPVVDNKDQELALFAVKYIKIRVDLIALEDQIQGDEYTFIRDAYLQRRYFLINDGKLEKDDFFDEEDEEVSDDDF